MQYKRLMIRAASIIILILSAIILPVTVILSAALVSANVSGLEASGPTEAATGWRLTEARVICSGETTVIADGALTGGHVIEATAIPAGRCSTLGKKGRFRMTLTAFLPSRAVPGQRPGYWEVRGIWSISNESAANYARGGVSARAVATGILFTELPFNPATSQGIIKAAATIKAAVTLVVSPGQGTFSGNEKFEGFISLCPESSECPETSETLPNKATKSKGDTP